MLLNFIANLGFTEDVPYGEFGKFTFDFRLFLIITIFILCIKKIYNTVEKTLEFHIWNPRVFFN